MATPITAQSELAHACLLGIARTSWFALVETLQLPAQGIVLLASTLANG